MEVFELTEAVIVEQANTSQRRANTALMPTGSSSAAPGEALGAPSRGAASRAKTWECGAGQGQALAQGRVGVVTEALGIRHGDQPKVEGTSLRAELIDIALTDQGLIHPAALWGYLAECGQRDRTFVHGDSLRGEALNHPEYRVPIVAACGPSWRCPLVARSP
jgi:hypothetical protein